MKNFLFWFAVAERRQAETHLIILDSVQKKLEFQPKGTAPQNKNSYNIAIFILWCGDAGIRTLEPFYGLPR